MEDYGQVLALLAQHHPYLVLLVTALPGLTAFLEAMARLLEIIMPFLMAACRALWRFITHRKGA